LNYFLEKTTFYREKTGYLYVGVLDTGWKTHPEGNTRDDLEDDTAEAPDINGP
jgi:hypothetical protein